MKKRMIALSAVILMMACCTLSIYASEGGFSLSRLTFSANGPFRLNPVMDTVLGGTGIAITGTSLLMEKYFPVKNDVWDGNSLDINDVPAIDRFLMKPYSDRLDTFADILVYSSVLLPSVLMSTGMEEWLTVGVMYGEALLLSYGVKDILKNMVTRARPYMYFDEKSLDDLGNGDWNDSFPSGHTTGAFAGAAFASYVFGQFFPDSPWKYAVTAASYTMAALTAGLRMAGGEHFLTDMLAGALIGTASGILVPWLHSVPVISDNVQPLIYADGVSLRFLL